jgi:uncharacterized protein (TIGR02145 family)
MKNFFTLIFVVFLVYSQLKGQDFSGTHFRNGEVIPFINSEEEWKIAGENKQPAWCYNENKPSNGAKYGKLYNWYAVTDPRGLCPVGWHVPSDAEWTLLVNYIGGQAIAGNKMKSTSDWYKNANGDNSVGFNGLPGGYCILFGAFSDVGMSCAWWSSTRGKTDCSLVRKLNYEDGKIIKTDFHRSNGASVRCLKD